MNRAEELLKLDSKAKADRDGMVQDWREISDYFRPVKQFIDQPTANLQRNRRKTNRLFDTSGISANQTYAAGCMDWMTPSTTPWSAYDPPEYLKGDDRVKSWYSTCTDVTRQVLSGSNFYQQIHNCYLDDGAFGTSALLTEEDSQYGIRFEALQIGDYSILENEKGEVDTVFRTLRLTPRQASQKFGDKIHSTVKEKLENNSDEKAEYLHVTMPRSDSDRVMGMIDGENMPFASIYIDCKNKVIVRESGSWEMPIAVHRHDKFSHSPYGFSPGMRSLPDIRQLNLMQQYLDALVEKQVSPPVLVPSKYEGQIDLRAGGMTYFKDDASKPQFWNNPGHYPIGQDRTEFRANQINRAFHVDLFQALAAVPPGKEMTATEINMRQRDRLTLFSPTFARKNSELNTPVMRRVFALLLRAGAFPQAPENLISIGPDGLPFLPDPEITYTSRLALQMKAIHNDSFTRSLQMLMPMAEVNPGIFDHIDQDEAARSMMRNEGLPEKWLRSERDVDALRQARAQQEAQIAEQEAAMGEAEAISKLSSSGALS